jgi:protein O-GlcNAc transferase
MTLELERLLADGLAAEMEGNVRVAAARYEAAINVAAAQVLPWLRLGTLCHRIRQHARAREVLEQAAQLDPNNPEVAFRLGLTYDALEDRPQAQAAYTRSVVLDPSSWQTWFLIGRDHRQLGHAEVARLAYLRALEVAPDEAQVLAELGSLLWEMGRRDEAFPPLERAASVCRVDPGISLQLGLAELERGDLLAAQRQLVAAKHLDPLDESIDVALRNLASRKRDVRRPKAA